MESSVPHLLIETGPEKGRELTIPAKGARLGRATENDISIADATMSRFQCRMYFRDSFLHVMDLGSTNETLVNNQPVSDTILRFGDEVLIGESVIKVINDGLHEPETAHPEPKAAAAPAEEPAPAPIVFNTDPEPEPAATPAAPVAHDADDVDLGLGRRNEFDDSNGTGEKKSILPLILVALVTMLVVLGIGVAVIMSTAPAQTGGTAPVQDNRIRIEYEKVISGEGNVFRYALVLTPEGELTAEVHDLRQQRDIVRKETLAPERLNPFQTQLAMEKDMFVSLQESYEGLPVGDHEAYRLTVIFGREAKTVRVANQLEPDAFRQIREQIESFANNELGLINIDIPPEELRARADESWKNSQDLYAQRDVKNENLWQASQKLKDVIFLLETIEPKPEYYEQAVLLRQQWRKQLEDKIRNLEFEAIRAMQVGETRRAAELNRRILATFPERSHSEYKEAYNRLVQIEQELN
jgi:hypothetical protein